MSQSDKLLKRLFQRQPPKDFTYNELISLMKHFGYEVHQGSGSRISFGPNDDGDRVHMHAPHGAGENALKKYQIEQIKKFLQKEGMMK